MNLIPLHGVRDLHKFDTLIDSISLYGWRGAPLVKWGSDLLTGSHRYAACRALGWSDNDIPVIDIEDVFAEAGLNWAVLYAEHRVQQPEVDDWDILVELLSKLPPEIVKKYGMEIYV
ncbi:hypothetical protein SAMN02745218_02970 [Desulfofundulus australicus DSM 11792]|uniref:ParB-like nuclease domain-containing protein n=1 Tax=Desulfofundulus australicus DSM 11792 TaxID=1121425 RepID=A0A1M5E1Z1_9FIRM|nr:ParB/Srx family N-terminal domain-containing protein [Desulfofundulus australicus]SHF73180.1 hypothetical protein SAMN02745218_02970 [Desulfofundulus australicus DSM 11792]